MRYTPVLATWLLASACTNSESLSPDSGLSAPPAPEQDRDAGSANTTAVGYAHFTIPNLAASGLPNPASYSVSDVLVVDEVTELTWQKIASTAYWSFDEAGAHCAALKLGGHSDFRVPSRIELVTILDFSQNPVAVSAFTEVISDYHWTSSRGPEVSDTAYSVYFGAGETTIASAAPGRALVRCVAGAITRPAKQFEAAGEFTRDLATGLQWERAAGMPSSLDAAAARCTERNLRLPSIRELQSIVDETRHTPALDVSFFDLAALDGDDSDPELDDLLFWSSTLRGSDPWHVDFKNGKTYANRWPEEALRSRCVR